LTTPARSSSHTRFFPKAWADVTSCQGWRATVNNPQHRLHVRNAPPILITNSRVDVSTPHAGAVAIARQIPNAILLTYDGGGHGDYLLSPCTRNAIDHYLTTRQTPRSGAHCPARPQKEHDRLAGGRTNVK
jgi:pimeloyl-ACP methyl ester carboxylesterase